MYANAHVEREPDKTRILDAREALLGDTTAAQSATNPTDEAANELVANFRLKRVIGQSVRGVTYLAEQLHPRQAVALKLVGAALPSPEAQRQFERDVAPLTKLDHPGIARLLEADVVHTGAGPRPYFASEYVRGVSPVAHSRLKRLGVAERVDLLARVCDAVQHAHGRGLVHGDIKMFNVVVADADGRPKLLDFGVARVLADVDHTCTSGDDIAALGAVARELLTDGLPLRRGIEAALTRATHADPARRHASARDLAADLRRHTGSGLGRARRWLLPAVLILTVCLVLLLVFRAR